MPSEWHLVAGIFALYLFDSIRMLYANEVMFSAIGGRWRYRAAGTWLLSGRSLHVCNLLTPFAVTVRAHWSPRSVECATTTVLDASSRRVTLEQALSGALLMAVLVVVPLALVLFGNRAFLAALLLVYVLIMVQLVQIWRQRKKYGLGPKQYWLLAADGLLCAPFAINTYRKLTLRTWAGQDALVLACRVLEPQQLDAFVKMLIVKVDADIQLYDDNDALLGRLGNFKSKLEGLQT